MALYTPTLVAPMSQNYGATTNSTTVTVITPAGGGDFIQLIGRTVTLRFQTAGTGATVTFDSVDPSNMGTDVNVTCVLAATAVSYVKIDATVSRWKQNVTNIGYLALTYSSVVTLTLEASYES